MLIYQKFRLIIKSCKDGCWLIKTFGREDSKFKIHVWIQESEKLQFIIDKKIFHENLFSTVPDVTVCVISSNTMTFQIWQICQIYKFAKKCFNNWNETDGFLFLKILLKHGNIVIKYSKNQ